MNGSRLLPLCIGVLIDTWWNVNSRTELPLRKSKTVLIDTWWNVNITCSNGYKLNAQVLIDTWWNVN